MFEEHMEHLRHILSEMVGDVKLVVFTQEMECQFCKEVRLLVETLAKASGKIKLEFFDFVKDAEKARQYKVDKIPAIAILGEGGAKDYRIKFYGIPSGYEITSLLEDIVDVSRGATRLSEPMKEKVRSIKRPVHIQVFVTPSCPLCPRAVRIAHQFAMENEHIRADVVEVVEFPHIAQKYRVMGTPKVVMNEFVELMGAQPEEHYLEHLILAASKQTDPMFS